MNFPKGEETMQRSPSCGLREKKCVTLKPPTLEQQNEKKRTNIFPAWEASKSFKPRSTDYRAGKDARQGRHGRAAPYKSSCWEVG